MRSGAIVYVASTSGLRWTGSAQVGYAATKAGVIQLSRVVAVQHAPDGIRVNTVIPGQLHTPMVEARLAKQRTGGDVDALLAQRQSRIPLGFMGARTVVTVTLLRFSFRRVLDGMRGVDQLIWALAFVRAVGLGPLAGVLAIFVSDIGILSKLYAEAIENAEKRQAEGVTAAGGGRLLGIRFGLLPQVAPVMLAQALYFFESNTRSASILGVVGAGGIGLQIAERIRVRHWDEVAFIIILMIITVAAIDWISGRIRRRLITAAR
jgi:phosphonate ABC transporter permease subunit PhnE